VFMLARLIALGARIRTDGWIVTGADRGASGEGTDTATAAAEVAAVTQTP